ncbi:cilia- and flagella-associated protein 157-like [Seriola aureovittata]|uniref:cilia- and flagella-associated protein 157-like n=1 Tax=Seriola aureovittata TaxID=2871759 RepID=UPI0024BE668E|nr:cilia- and flagella-associated protein 157-like [Seriola aureovittata]
MADEIASDDKEKSLYLTQIRFLDEQLERCQLKCDELDKQNKDLASLCSALGKDKDDIAQYLKHSVAAEERKLEELVERLERQQLDTEQEIEAMKLQQRHELQERTEELNSESRIQGLQMEEQKPQMEELKQQTEEVKELMVLLPEQEALERQLVSEKEEYEASYHSLTLEVERERNKMAVERRRRVKEGVKTKVSELLLEERARHRERLEKVELLLCENKDVWNQKDALRFSESLLCSELDNLRKCINKVTKVVSARTTETEELTKANQQLEAEMQEWSISYERMQDEEKHLRQSLASVSEEYRQRAAELDQLEVEIQEERSRRWQLEGDMQEAAVIIRQVLTDSEESSDTQLKMQRLVEILESTAPEGTGTAPEGTGPAPNDPAEDSSTGQPPQTSGPKPSRAETLNMATDPLFLMARYRPGDLGLIPRPSWKHGPGSSATAVGDQQQETLWLSEDVGRCGPV